MIIFLTVLHVMVCIILIVVVLLQRGKGAEIGAVFGGGASSTVFGSRGAGNFLTKLTSFAAVIFMVTSLCLSYLGSKSFSKSILDEESKKSAAEESGKFAEPAKGAAAPEKQSTAPDAQAPAGPAQEAPAPTKP